jgi:hypothetical protein
MFTNEDDMDKELKENRVVVMLTASELEAIDTWGFDNRIRSRGEAMRRLCHLGMEPARQNRLKAKRVDLYPARGGVNLSIETTHGGVDIELTSEQMKSMVAHIAESMMAEIRGEP